MSKRERRNRENQRRFSATQRPNTLLATWVEPGPPIPEEAARRAFIKLKAQRFARTIYRPTGPDRRCYVNVNEQVARFGGEPTTGWLLTVNPAPHVDAGRNKFAKYSLEAHCVWRKDDRLIEVTDGGHCKFIADDSVVSMTNGNLFFCDDLSCAQRIMQMPIPVGMKGGHVVITL